MGILRFNSNSRKTARSGLWQRKRILKRKDWKGWKHKWKWIGPHKAAETGRSTFEAIQFQFSKRWSWSENSVKNDFWKTLTFEYWKSSTFWYWWQQSKKDWANSKWTRLLLYNYNHDTFLSWQLQFWKYKQQDFSLEK